MRLNANIVKWESNKFKLTQQLKLPETNESVAKCKRYAVKYRLARTEGNRHKYDNIQVERNYIVIILKL